ncbi:MAG TPA: DNA repair protein RecO [Myxococcota bacterium]|nr:DNA repair protein RecO [Myxococcota bacterium]
MNQDCSDRAFVLSRVPYRESDLILGLLCRSAGPLSVVARSARASRRRFPGVLDFFVVFDAAWSQGRGGLPALASAEPVRFFPGILDQLERLEAGQTMVRMVREATRDSPASVSLFDTVVQAFGYLEQARPDLAHLVSLELALAIATELGHAPSDGVCPACGRRAARFHVAVDGLVVCRECCATSPGHALALPEIYPERRPLADNPSLEADPRMPGAAESGIMISSIVSGITGVPWQTGPDHA